MKAQLIRITYCFYVDGNGNIWFGIEDFIHEHGIPDCQEMRQIIALDIKEMVFGVLIVEEELASLSSGEAPLSK